MSTFTSNTGSVGVAGIGNASVLPGEVCRSAGFLTCCIADFQSADATNFQCHTIRPRRADWKSAIQQIGNLRYGRARLSDYRASSISSCVIGRPVAGTSGRRRCAWGRTVNRSARCRNNSSCCGKGSASTADSISASVLTGRKLTRRRPQRQGSMKSGDKTGGAIGAFTVRDTDEIMLITVGGQMMRTFVRDIRKAGRNTMGVELVDLDPGDKLQAIA